MLLFSVVQGCKCLFSSSKSGKKKNLLAVNESLHGPSPYGRTDPFFVSYAHLLNKKLCLFMETIFVSSCAM